MKFRLWLLLGFVIISPYLLNAQERKPVPYFWVQAGSGAVAVQNEHGQLGVGIQADIEFKKQLLGLRYLHGKEFAIFYTPHQVDEFALLWGKYFLGLEGDVYASLAGGPAVETYYTYGAVKPNPASNGFGTYHYLVANNVIGLALDGHAGVNFGRFFSLGVHAFANLNTEKIIGGAMFDLRLGYLRKQ